MFPRFKLLITGVTGDGGEWVGMVFLYLSLLSDIFDISASTGYYRGAQLHIHNDTNKTITLRFISNSH